MKKTKVVKLEEPEILERVIDWDAIEAEYRVGLASLRAMGDRYGCSEAAIRKRAGKYKWVRDLSAKVRQRAEELVRREEVRAASAQEPVLRTDDDRAYETEVIEASATAVASVLLTQKKILDRHANLASSFLAELEGMSDLREDFEHLGELLYAPDERGVDKLNVIYQKVIDLPGRVDTYKKLSDSLKVLIGLQRQAVGLSDNSNGDADKPADAPAMSDMEVARRMAFILTRGTKEQP